MKWITAWPIAAMLALSGAQAQEDPKGDKEKAEAAARKALEGYRADLAKATTPGAAVMAIMSHLHSAAPHPLIRATLASVLNSHPFIDAKIAAADALGKYKKDREAAHILMQNAKLQKEVDLQRKCLRRFGEIAPYGMSTELTSWFSNGNPDLAGEAILAAAAVNSVRMLAPLIDLLGELESTAEEKFKNSIQEPPLPGAPGNTPMDTRNQKYMRKKKLTDPTRKAINDLWRKVDPKAPLLKMHKEALAALQQNRKRLLEIQEAEDLEDRGPKPSDKDSKKDSK